MHEQHTVYDMVGGAPTFEKLVNIFYSKVENDELLRSIFPDDFEAGKHWQCLFLIQLFGGPSDYNQQRGHPRLRMRHASFRIDERVAQLWLSYMLEAIDEIKIDEPARSMMHEYFVRAASHMVNAYLPEDS
jgi:hemoglobin